MKAQEHPGYGYVCRQADVRLTKHAVVAHVEGPGHVGKPRKASHLVLSDIQYQLLSRSLFGMHRPLDMHLALAGMQLCCLREVLKLTAKLVPTRFSRLTGKVCGFAVHCFA